jgi:hypothetical protein
MGWIELYRSSSQLVDGPSHQVHQIRIHAHERAHHVYERLMLPRELWNRSSPDHAWRARARSSGPTVS